MEFTVTEIAKEALDIQEYESLPGKSVFTTMEWLEFIQEDSQVAPLFLRITRGETLVGYFTAMIQKSYGFRIIASPFAGWSTCYMGFDLVDPSVNKLDLIPCVTEYLFKVKKAHLIEIVDRDISVEDAQARGYRTGISDTLELEIDRTDEELFKVFKTDCRNFIRQFERRGAALEYAEPDDTFAQEYYTQLQDVFAKQGLVPTYSLEKDKCLLRHLRQSGNVLCLRVRDPEGNCIATSIFPGYNGKFFFWGGASYRSGQHYRPNEYMLWTAIRYWREKGFTMFDMVGVRDYKRKFGSHEVQYAHISLARSKIVFWLRDSAKNAFFFMLRIKGKLLKRK